MQSSHLSPSSTPLDPQHATVIVTRADAKKGHRLARHLRADGFNVHEAHDARELIAWCRAFRTAEDKLPDVVITDAGLPDMSGLKAVEELKADGGVPPFIVIAQSDDWRTFMAAERLGAAYVFEQSPDDSALRNAVFSLTGSW
jgi:DNA-binding response OmpR family regulator